MYSINETDIDFKTFEENEVIFFTAYSAKTLFEEAKADVYTVLSH